MKRFEIYKDYIEMILIRIGIAILILFTILVGIYLCTIDYQNKETIEITVKDKYIKRIGESDRYLIVSEAGDTYKISDLLWIGKFNSTDLYNQLDIGKTYKVDISGLRWQFFSMYKNINKIESEEN